MEARYAHVDATQSPPRVTFPRRYNAAVDLLDRHVAQGRGARVACVDDAGSVTYAALAERAARVAAVLRALGIAPEQRALLCLHDTADFHAVFLGALRAGVVPVPVNTLLTPADYAFMLADSRARVLFVSDALYPKLAAALLACGAPVQTVVVRSPLGGPDGGNARLDELLERAEPLAEVFDSTADDVAFWLYSSGSTGAPKGAVHLHSHLVHTAALYAGPVLGVSETDVVFSAAKLFFAYGLGNALTFPLYAGASAVLLAERPTPAAVMRTLEAHRPTIFCGVPTLFASILGDGALAAHPGSARLRASISAGEALPRHIGERWRARFGTDILDGIGSTEMLHIFLSNRHGEVRYGTSGRPVPGYELKLVDDDGAGVPDEVEGDLWVRGPTSCVGYWNQREKSLATFHGPWTRTGDRYVRDTAGYYRHAGRADDMLKVGGIWVSPLEVESALAAHPAVHEVGVAGDADADGLIKPRAVVVLRADYAASEELAEELKTFVKARLAPFKYPRWIVFVAELPRTATGKLQRYRLRG